ncbi:MAG: hypothetical protein HRT82_11035 [Henriciella sp.]|nr:hypothetical protein [Henriciella sp.]
MIEPNEIVPKLLDLKHQNQVRQLSAVMAEIRLIERKQKELVEERAKLDRESDGFARISLQNGYGRYLQARDQAFMEQVRALQDKAAEIQKSIKETMCSQSILRDDGAV